MGWGKKTAGAKPQPKRAQLEDGEPMGTDNDGNGVYWDAAKGEPYNAGEPLAPDEKPTDAAKAEAAWAKLRSTKGWVPETVAMVLYEFIKDRGLFADLVKYAKGRR